MCHRETDLLVPCPLHPQSSFFQAQQRLYRQALSRFKELLADSFWWPSLLGLVSMGAIVMTDGLVWLQPMVEGREPWSPSSTDRIPWLLWHCESHYHTTRYYPPLHPPHYSCPLEIHSTLPMAPSPVVAWMPWEGILGGNREVDSGDGGICEVRTLYTGEMA